MILDANNHSLAENAGNTERKLTDVQKVQTSRAMVLTAFANPKGNIAGFDGQARS